MDKTFQILSYVTAISSIILCIIVICYILYMISVITNRYIAQFSVEHLKELPRLSYELFVLISCSIIYIVLEYDWLMNSMSKITSLQGVSWDLVFMNLLFISTKQLYDKWSKIFKQYNQ